MFELTFLRFASGRAMLALVVFLTGSSGFATAQDTTAEITALLKERSDVLNKAVKLFADDYERGVGVFDYAVAHLCKDAVHVDLELANGIQQRIAVLQKFKGLADRILKITEASNRAGVARNSEVLQARDFQLAIRIDLLKEQRKMRERKE